MAFDIAHSTEKMNNLKEQMKKLRDKANELGKTAFTDACKSLFAEHPQLKAIKWTQYTPYFNDGDECTFGVNDPYMRLEGTGIEAFDIAEDDGDYGDGFVEVCDYTYSKGKRSQYPEPIPTIVANVKAVLNLIGEDTCRELFGDHVQVTVTAEGVDTEDWLIG